MRRFVFKTLAAQGHAGVTTFPLPRFLLLLVVVVVMAFAPSGKKRSMERGRRGEEEVDMGEVRSRMAMLCYRSVTNATIGGYGHRTI